MLARKIQAFIESQGLLCADDRILVAYSGGADSTCLLLILRELGRNVSAGYINHHLRGEESMKEEQSVRQFCERHNIALHVERLTWRNPGATSEAAARRKRYAALRKMAAEHDYTKIAVAHHQQDVVETFLLQLLRGSGPRGLSGLRAKNGSIVRPLLSVSRDEILEYLAEKKINYFTDSSNVNTRYRRNRVRNELLPYVRRHFNPQADAAIARAVRWINEQNQLTEELLKPYFAMIRRKPAGIFINRKSWQRLPASLRKAVIQKAVQTLDPAASIRASTVDRLLEKIETRQEMELPGFAVVKSSAGSIRITPKTGQTGFFETDVPHEGTYEFPPANISLTFSVTDRHEHFGMKDVAFVDFDKASFPLYIRNWKKGDAFTPLGMKGTKKISDLFVDRKVPQTSRKKVPIVMKDEEIIWVAGHQLNNNFRVTDHTQKVLKIEMKYHDV